jgi:hypothetical membrane protein
MSPALKTKLPVLLALLLLLPIYVLPVWWVSLTAPNYPKESFPDGVKIHFHLNGVFNGCQLVEKAEIRQEEALDCVHEMDTINHYVGMYPIAAGAPIEVSISIFLVTMVAVMLLGWTVEDPRRRTWLLAGGFALVALWMALALYLPGGLKLHNGDYLNGRVVALGHGDDAEEPAPAQVDSAQDMIARLKAALSEDKTPAPEPAPGSALPADASRKQRDIAALEQAFRHNQTKLQIDEEWRGTGLQLLAWHYRSSLARWFNDPARINPMVRGMSLAVTVVFVVLLGLMVLLVAASRRRDSLFHRLLLLVPVGLPLFFVGIFAAWLHWYGHNMNEMGAFTLKAFMPTVFGQGKVAQFTTNSYPHVGFYLMLLFAGLLLFAFVSDRKLRLEKAKDEQK